MLEIDRINEGSGCFALEFLEREATPESTMKFGIRLYLSDYHFQVQSRHCLVLHLLRWRLSIESLMRSLAVVVMHELLKPLACARPTAHPRVMEAVDAHFEGVEPLFDMVPVGIVEVTAQP